MMKFRRFYYRHIFVLILVLCISLTFLLVCKYRPWTSFAGEDLVFSEVQEVTSHGTVFQKPRTLNITRSTPLRKHSNPEPAELFWFFKNGTIWPTKSDSKNVKTSELLGGDKGDRILQQLMYVPEDYDSEKSPLKIILGMNGINGWRKKSGQETFQECPVKKCSLMYDQRDAEKAEALLFKDALHVPLNYQRPKDQIFIMYYLESPVHTGGVDGKYQHTVNWTATYRHESDIVAPYEKWVYYDPQVRRQIQSRDFSANKTHLVAWFVSNCNTHNNRQKYVEELKKYIPVDIYGACGTKHCPRNNVECPNMLNNDYKFYLSFENSNCHDYITEKLFVNALGNNVIPVVMGAPREDYERSAPENSFIHVDDFAGPKELADYLKSLDEDRDAYNSYFEWKGTGEFINTYFWCRLCALLHAPKSRKNYGDINRWWQKNVCVVPKYEFL